MAPLPFSYYRAFLQRLIQREDVEFITYNELSWGEDFDYRHGYPKEWETWRAPHSLPDAKDKVYVLIQHDIDSSPPATHHMARVENEMGARSSIMTFVRWRVATMDPGRLEPYSVDWTEMKRLESEGFCIGYHCNVMQNAEFDTNRICGLFTEDVAFLKERLSLRFFSPHGGYRGPNGETNASIDYPEACGTRLRWVHNRFSPKFHKSYSDGALIGRIKDGTAVDLREWVDSLERGRRYRALIHPQYYDDTRFNDEEVSGPSLAPWYTEIIGEAKRNGIHEAAASYWKGSP